MGWEKLQVWMGWEQDEYFRRAVLQTATEGGRDLCGRS
jgi:hypothetical protein